jgi:predicted Zn-dependent protease
MQQAEGKFKSVTGEIMPCNIHFNNEELQIFQEGQSMIIWKISSLYEVRFDSSEIEFAHKNNSLPTLIVWGQNGLQLHHIWTIQNDPSFNTIKNKGKHKGLKLFLGLCLFIAAIIIGLYFFVIPILAETAADSFPITTEIELGDKMGSMYDAQAKNNDSTNYYLQSFLDKIKIKSPYPLSLKLIESEDINAFAVPGGKMYIYSGLLTKLKSYEELVALIGHESSHVRKRHSLKSLFRSATSAIAIALIIGDASGISAGLLNQADNLKQLNYSRDLETEADLEGLKLMEEKDINPLGMIGLLNVLLKATGENGNSMQFLNSHPDTEARIEAVNQKMLIKKDWKDKEDLIQLFNALSKHLKR